MNMLKFSSWKLNPLKILLEFIVAALIILWIYTSVSKFYDYENFKIQLGRSPFIAPMSNIISVMLPIGELLIATLLVFKKMRKIGLYMSFGVMLLFTGYIWIMLYFAYDLPCSCGGVLERMSWNDHLYFNIVYTILALVGIIIIERDSSKYKSILAMN